MLISNMYANENISDMHKRNLQNDRENIRETKIERLKKERKQSREKNVLDCAHAKRALCASCAKIFARTNVCTCVQSDDKVIYCRYCLTSTSHCSLKSRPLPGYIVNNYHEIHVTAECTPQPFSSSMALLIPLFIS